MSVQSSLNIAGVVTNTKASINNDLPSNANKLDEGNQLFSGILNSVSDENPQSLSTPSNGPLEEAGELVGPELVDVGTNTFASAANLDELEGRLLPLLPGAISNVLLDTQNNQTGLAANATTLANSPLSGSNVVLEQLRGLLADATNSVGESKEVTELRGQLSSLLDAKQSNISGAVDQALRNPILSELSQASLRQEVNASLGNARGAFNDFFDRIERARSSDFFDLNQSFFDTAQKKSTGLDEILATLTKTAPSSAVDNTSANINPILAQINSLVSGNVAITQPLLGAVADTASLLPSNPTQTQVAAPLNSSQWSEELGQRVRWLVGQNIGSAQIRLNPAELGPVELRVNVSGDQVSVAFNSQFGVVREALEAALPKLREMLESQGLNLADADINQGDTAERQSGSEANTAGNDGSTLDDSIEKSGLLASNAGGGIVELSSSNFVDQFV